jgi:hypothetical protein
LTAKGERRVSEWLNEWGTTALSVLALATALAVERLRRMGRLRRMARVKELDRLRRLGN